MASLQAITLEVRNLEKATAFYQELFGLRLLEQNRDQGRSHLALNHHQTLRLWRPTSNLPSAGLSGLERLRLRGGAHVHYALKIPRGSGQGAQKILEKRGIPYHLHPFGPVDLAIYFYDQDLHGLELRESDLMSNYAGSTGEVIPVFAFKEVVLEFNDLDSAQKRMQEIYGFPYLWGGIKPRSFVAYRLGGEPEVAEALHIEGADLFIWDPQTGIADMQAGEHVFLTLTTPPAELSPVKQRANNAGLITLEHQDSLFVKDPEGHVFEYRWQPQD